jgi:hypothetical protein
LRANHPRRADARERRDADDGENELTVVDPPKFLDDEPRPWPADGARDGRHWSLAASQTLWRDHGAQVDATFPAGEVVVIGQRIGQEHPAGRLPALQPTSGSVEYRPLTDDEFGEIGPLHDMAWRRSRDGRTSKPVSFRMEARDAWEQPDRVRARPLRRATRADELAASASASLRPRWSTSRRWFYDDRSRRTGRGVSCGRQLSVKRVVIVVTHD